MIAYYEVVKEEELWRKDIDDFEQAWAIYKSVKEGNINKLREKDKEREREGASRSRRRGQDETKNGSNKNVKD